MNTLRPTLYAESFASLPIEELGERGIKGLTLDVDGVFIDHDDEGYALSEANRAKFEEIGSYGIQLALLSNAGSPARMERVRGLAHTVSEVVDYYVFPITSGEVGHKKPHVAMYETASQVFRLPPRKIAHVGDQMLKDVWGANRANFGASVLVPRYGRGDDIRVKLFQRPVEVALRSYFGLPLIQHQAGTLENPRWYQGYLQS